MARKFVTIVRTTVTPTAGCKEFDSGDISDLLTDAIDVIEPDSLDAIIEWDFETFEVQEFPFPKEMKH